MPLGIYLLCWSNKTISRLQASFFSQIPECRFRISASPASLLSAFHQSATEEVSLTLCKCDAHPRLPCDAWHSGESSLLEDFLIISNRSNISSRGVDKYGDKQSLRNLKDPKFLKHLFIRPANQMFCCRGSEMSDDNDAQLPAGGEGGGDPFGWPTTPPDKTSLEVMSREE